MPSHVNEVHSDLRAIKGVDHVVEAGVGAEGSKALLPSGLGLQILPRWSILPLSLRPPETIDPTNANCNSIAGMHNPYTSSYKPFGWIPA